MDRKLNIKRVFILLSIYFFIRCEGITQSQNNWLWLNPYPQGNDLNAVFSFDQNSVIAFGNVGTFIKSSNGGNRWDVKSYIGDRSADLKSTYFVNSILGWVVGNEGHIAKTEDGGNTWTSQNSGTNQQLNSVFFINALNGWIVGNGGTILITSDGGNNWLLQSTTIKSNLNGVFFVDALNGWMISDSIYNSTNGGFMWESKPSNGNELLSIYFINRNIGWVAGVFGDVLHTTNAGASWTSQYPDTKTLHNYCSIFFIDSLTGWVVTDDEGVFKTINGGATWSYPRSGNISGSSFRWSIRFANAQIGWLVGIDGKMYKSTNGGAYWYPLFPTERNDIHALSLVGTKYAYTAGGLVLSSSYGTISRTTNGGLSWTTPLIDQGYNYWGIKFIDSANGFVVGDIDGYVGIIKKTTDAGLSWTQQLISYTASLYSVNFINKNIGSVVGYEYIMSTTDGGDVWNPFFEPGEEFKSVYYLNSQYAWAVGSSLYRTTNGGDSWEQISSIQGNDIYFSTYLTGWIVGSGGAINFSTDGGVTWNPQTSGTNYNLYSIEFRDNCSGWAVGDGGIICYTSDSGNNWFIQKSGTSRMLTSVQFTTSTTGSVGWTAGEHGTILSTITSDYLVQSSINKGWNMVSIPVIVSDYSKDKLYPTSSSEAYEYQNRYVATSTLSNGKGFWLKFRQTEVISNNGVQINQDSIEVTKGWNLIGSISYPVDTRQITTIPPNIISSSYYGYSGIYISTTTIQPGKAYWVKVSTNGKLILSASANLYSSKENNNDFNSFNRLVISDAEGKSQTLYFGKGDESSMVLSSTELPPVPPSNMFDVRFKSDRYLELYYHGLVNEFPIQLQAANYPITVRLEENINSSDKYNLVINKDGRLVLYSGYELRNSIVINNPTVNEFILKVEAKNYLPKTYSLLQNYPNPFNPTTTITYELPATSFVKLEVFNLLGQKIETLVDRNQEAGKHSVLFDVSASDRLASGVYYYKLETHSQTSNQDFVKVFKMILAK